MIHLVTLNPALDLFLALKEPSKGKIGEAASMDGSRGKSPKYRPFYEKMGRQEPRLAGDRRGSRSLSCPIPGSLEKGWNPSQLLEPKGSHPLERRSSPE